MGVPSKRRGYDSVDPDFDDDVPEAFPTSVTKPSTKLTLDGGGPNKPKSLAKDMAKDIGEKKDFYATFADVLNRNARWSTRTPVPKLGNDDTPRETVDKFYAFW